MSGEEKTRGRSFKLMMPSCNTDASLQFLMCAALEFEMVYQIEWLSYNL